MDSGSAAVTTRRLRDCSAASSPRGTENLRELSCHIRSPLFFAHIRAAIRSAVQQTNCQPFRHSPLLSQYGGTVIKTTLSDEDAKKLQEKLRPASSAAISSEQPERGTA